MAKNDGYDLSDALGKAAGMVNDVGQSAINDAHSDESGSPSEQSGSSLRDGVNGLKNAVEAPGRIADTAQNIKDGVKNTGEAIKNAPENIKKGIDRAKKAGEAVKNAPQNITNAVKNAPQNITNAVKNAPKNIANAVKNAPKNIINRITRRISKRIRRIKKTIKTIQMLIKLLIKIIMAFIKLIIWLISTLWPIILVIVIVSALAFFFMNNMSTTGDVITDTESINELNQTTINENEELIQLDVSSGTKIINAYYTYFSQKSLWVLMDENVYNCRDDKIEKNSNLNVSALWPSEKINGEYFKTPIQYGSAKFIELFKYDPFTGSGTTTTKNLIQDKYGRESSFYLNANAIQSIDNTLNHGQFRYPEQIVQKVKYKVVKNKDGTYQYELDQLADENGMLYTEDVYDSSGNLLHTGTLSTAYTQDETQTSATYTNGKGYNLWIPCINTDPNTGVSTVSEKVPGVWDYGFGSILHYLKYMEAHDNRGNVKSFQVLDKNQWNFTSNTATGCKPKIIKIGAIGNYYEGLSTGITVDLYKQGVIKEYSYSDWYAALSSGKTSTGGDASNLYAGDGSATDPTSDGFDTSRVYPLADTESYMIDWVVTPAGTMTSKIQAKWKDSGIPFDETENQKYTNGTINAMVVEHFKDGIATFKWDDSCVNSNNGSFTNPSANLQLVQYESTGNVQLDSKYTYATHNVTITMFNSEGNCNACGKPAVEKVYGTNISDSCYNRTYNVSIKGQSGTKEYTVTKDKWLNRPLKVNSETGKVTQNPYVEIPKYWIPSSNAMGGYWSSEKKTYYLTYTDSNTNTDKCKKSNHSHSAAKVSSYKATDHSGCTTVKYEYDVIKMKEVDFTDSEWGLDGQSITLTRYIEGTRWDKEPSYSGEPDMSGITGTKYYEDYFNHYETYIPEKVQGDFDFNEIKNQTGLEEEQLLALLDREGISTEITTMSFEDYFEGGTAFATVENDGTMKNYVGPGMSVVHFETSYFNPSGYGNIDYPSYGCCQMIEANVKAFYKWICEDSDKEALWDKIFDGCDIICSDYSEFTRRWKDADKVLSTDEYVTWGLYQLSYMYYSEGLGSSEKGAPKKLADIGIDFNRSRVLQEFVFETTNQGWSGSAYERAIDSGAINSSSTDEDIINAVCDQYATVCNWKDPALTQTMRNKWNTTIRNFYLDLATKDYPAIGWDADKNVFADENVVAGSSSSGWSLGKLWRALTFQEKEPDGTVHFIWNDVFKNSQIGIEEHTTSGLYYGTDANSAVERIHYKTNAVAPQDVNWEIAKIFATIDKVTVDTYYPLTDDFFILKYEELFSSDIGKKWSTGTGFTKYFGSNWSNVFSKSSHSTDPTETDYSDLVITQLNEFNLEENETILKMSVATGSNIDENKTAASIHSVADGVVLEIGSDVIYGGNYIAIEYDNCIVYYGGLSVNSDLEKGKTVFRQALIGHVGFGNFFYLAMKTDVNGSYIDPTKLLQSGSTSEIVDDARKFLGTDYEWGGSGKRINTGTPCCSSGDHATATLTGSLEGYEFGTGNKCEYSFDCSGLIYYLLINRGYNVGSRSGARTLSTKGIDVTDDYMVNGSIDWNLVPPGTVIFLNTTGDSQIDHVGLWTGYSLLHASGGNPWTNGSTNTYGTSHQVCFRPEKNHAVNGKMVKEDYIFPIPADIESEYQQEIQGKTKTYYVLQVSDWWVDKVVQLNDMSSCKATP